jgi:hypothetical protein
MGSRSSLIRREKRRSLARLMERSKASRGGRTPGSGEESGLRGHGLWPTPDRPEPHFVPKMTEFEAQQARESESLAYCLRQARRCARVAGNGRKWQGFRDLLLTMKNKTTS